MSKVVKEVKKGVKSATRKVKGALEGDFDDILSVATLGTTTQLENVAKQLNPFKIPDPVQRGAIQANVDRAAPDVDLAATEASRRVGGQAVGTRRLKIPLGGL